MKKTATITFHRTLNYGAILQAYALQVIINKMGLKNEIIDYECDKIRKNYCLIKKNSVKLFIKSILVFKNMYLRKKKFEKFAKEKLNITEKIKKETLYTESFNNQYDLFITGSDQVWNYEIIGSDNSYLLDFVKNNKKKRSYAASFGVSSIPLELIDRYKKYIEDFSEILVREKTGKDIIKMITKRPSVNIVLDPVFLLEKKEWEKVLLNSKFDDIANKYILMYMPTENLIKFANYLADKYKLEIYNIADADFTNGHLENALGPEEFISAIKNAKFIVTGSFHAVAFSIIYNKEFFINNVDEIKENRSSRQKDLLNLLEVADREIFNHNDDKEFIAIDWNNVNEKLEIERNKSLNELKKMLGVND